MDVAVAEFHDCHKIKKKKKMYPNFGAGCRFSRSEAPTVSPQENWHQAQFGLKAQSVSDSW